MPKVSTYDELAVVDLTGDEKILVSDPDGGAAGIARLSREALASLVGGLVPLTPVATLVAPVASFEVALPAGYIYFEMLMINLRVVEGDFGVGLRLSTDAGANWYDELGDYSAGGDHSIQPGTASPGTNALIAKYIIVPGDATYPARWSQTSLRDSSGAVSYQDQASTLLAIGAAGLRINRMQFKAYESDVRTITADAYQLFGFPAPV